MVEYAAGIMDVFEKGDKFFCHVYLGKHGKINGSIHIFPLVYYKVPLDKDKPVESVVRSYLRKLKVKNLSQIKFYDKDNVVLMALTKKTQPIKLKPAETLVSRVMKHLVDTNV